ncbi:MAG: hypothetical protein E7330_00950 [Clostridiales bacterium]|nr:hypothetical protein [Clostridiales bacterium]
METYRKTSGSIPQNRTKEKQTNREQRLGLHFIIAQSRGKGNGKEGWAQPQYKKEKPLEGHGFSLTQNLLRFILL